MMTKMQTKIKMVEHSRDHVKKKKGGTYLFHLVILLVNPLEILLEILYFLKFTFSLVCLQIVQCFCHYLSTYLYFLIFLDHHHSRLPFIQLLSSFFFSCFPCYLMSIQSLHSSVNQDANYFHYKTGMLLSSLPSKLFHLSLNLLTLLFQQMQSFCLKPGTSYSSQLFYGRLHVLPSNSYM